MRKLKSLQRFILEAESLRIYRSFAKKIRRVEDEAMVAQLQGELRSAWEGTREVGDTELKMLLYSSKNSMKMLDQILSFTN